MIASFSSFSFMALSNHSCSSASSSGLYSRFGGYLFFGASGRVGVSGRRGEGAVDVSLLYTDRPPP